MKKLMLIICILTFSSLSFGATITSMNKNQISQAFINKTAISIPTDNLNGRDINNTFSVFLDGQGNAWGKMSSKPENQPQTDKGIYTIKNNGVNLN